ncbi:MAG: hypothetical protein AB1426_09600 [Bacillota bacterium]
MLKNEKLNNFVREVFVKAFSRYLGAMPLKYEILRLISQDDAQKYNLNGRRKGDLKRYPDLTGLSEYPPPPAVTDESEYGEEGVVGQRKEQPERQGSKVVLKGKMKPVVCYN